MKIKKVILENFQSHKYTELEFEETLNTIVGHSDSGKTSILRGIRWVLYNEPSGYEFIREGASEAKVTLTFQNHAEVTRLRSSSKNQYIVKSSNGEEQTYEGFGVGVPDEVLEVTKIGKTSIDKKTDISINYASQLEGPFLLSEKDSMKAAAIGKLVGVDIVDKAMRNTLRDKKKISSNLGNLILEKERLENELKEYEYLDDLKNKRDKLAILKQCVSNHTDKKDDLVSIQLRLTAVRNDENKLKKELRFLKNIHNIDVLIHNMNLAVSKLKQIRILWNRLNKNSDEQIKEKTNLNNLLSLDFLEKTILRIQQRVRSFNHIFELNKKYVEIQSDKRDSETTIQSTIFTDQISSTHLKNLYNKYDIFFKLRDEYRENKENQKKGISFLLNYASLDRVEILIDQLKLEKIQVSRMRQLSDKNEFLRKKSMQIMTELKDTDMEIQSLSAEYLKYLEKIGTCPVCRQSIEGEDLRHIEEFLREM